MCDALPTITPEVQRLINMEDEVITAAQLAPILKMHPQTIIDRAKSGLWDQDRLGKFVISGDRVKFFRKDFLQKCGFIEPEEPKQPTDLQILGQLIALNEASTMICQMLTLMMEPYQLDALNELLEKKKSASAATPTD